MGKIGIGSMRYSKLIEAVGLFLILGSWFFEWQNVRTWNDRKFNFDYSVTSVNYATTTLDYGKSQDRQYAMSRCFQNKEIDYDYNKILSIVEQSWLCAEVRRESYKIIDAKLSIIKAWRDVLTGFV